VPGRSSDSRDDHEIPFGGRNRRLGQQAVELIQKYAEPPNESEKQAQP
jgi:hypothetical protein